MFFFSDREFETRGRWDCRSSRYDNSIYIFNQRSKSYYPVFLIK
jgi:hypothetical protein